MKKPTVIAISGSPSLNSTTRVVTDLVAAKARVGGTKVVHYCVRDISPHALVNAEIDDPTFRTVFDALSSANGVIIATPIYKASFSGLLKMFLDVLPPNSLVGKVVLPVATAGSPQHGLALDYSLRPVLQSLAARHITQSVLFCPDDLSSAHGSTVIRMPAETKLLAALRDFQYSLTTEPAASVLGHPELTPPAVAGGSALSERIKAQQSTGNGRNA